MNAYNNMAGPSRSMAHQVIRPVGRQIVFGIYEIDFSYDDNTPKPFPPPRDFPSPQEWLSDFLNSHKAELACVQRPTGFMVGVVCKDENADKLCRDAGSQDDFLICKDPILAISVLGRIAGSIYIPHRQITLGSWFDKDERYIFPARYFECPPKPSRHTEEVA